MMEIEPACTLSCDLECVRYFINVLKKTLNDMREFNYIPSSMTFRQIVHHRVVRHCPNQLSPKATSLPYV
jgi:hypothetical protein